MEARKYLQRVLRLMSRIGANPRAHVPEDAAVTFFLVYHGMPIGELSIRQGLWSFRYTDEFRSNKELRPLIMFPDPEKTYETKELWPFFRMRIPSLKQPAVRAIVEREHIDEHNLIDLLKRFGRRTVSNPFELVASDPVQSLGHL